MNVADRRKRERQERRDLILDAAERVFFDQGLAAATMDEVASRAGLGKGTLYLYFRNKDDLRMGVATRHQAALLQRMAEAHADAADGLDELRRLLVVYAEHLSKPIERLSVVLDCWVNGGLVRHDSPHAGEHVTHIRRTFSMFTNAVVRGRNDGTIRFGPAASRVALQLWTFVNGALLFRLQQHHMAESVPLAKLDSTLIAPTLEESIAACLDGVRAHDAVSAPEPAAESDSELRTDEVDEREHESPGCEPRAAAAAGEQDGGAKW